MAEVRGGRSAGQETVSYDYDLSGLQLKASAASGAYTYGYDTAGRPISETSPFFGTIGWSLDGNGNRTTLSWPGTPAYAVNYAYDQRDRLTGVYFGAQSADTRVVYQAYDSLSQRIQATFGTGTSGKATTKYAWTLGGQVGQIAHAWSGGGVTIDYGYNQDHQRTSAAWSDDTFLPSGLAAASPAYAPNALNQYATVAGVTYGYDANGNLTSDGVWTYGYDSENRLVSAKRTAAPAVTATYGYDPLGRRRSKTVNGVVTRYLSVGDQEIAEYTGSTPVATGGPPWPSARGTRGCAGSSAGPARRVAGASRISPIRRRGGVGGGARSRHRRDCRGGPAASAQAAGG